MLDERDAHLIHELLNGFIAMAGLGAIIIIGFFLIMAGHWAYRSFKWLWRG